MRSVDTKQVSERRAEECRGAAAELQSLVGDSGGSAEDSGSMAGAARRGWVAVKATLAGYTGRAILEEAERVEDTALERYRATLDKDLPPQLRDVVLRQYEGVKRNHAQVRTLRNQSRMASA
jgi:uncharacterized protein (TIGR02284 family)